MSEQSLSCFLTLLAYIVVRGKRDRGVSSCASSDFSLNTLKKITRSNSVVSNSCHLSQVWLDTRPAFSRVQGLSEGKLALAMSVMEGGELASPINLDLTGQSSGDTPA